MTLQSAMHPGQTRLAAPELRARVAGKSFCAGNGKLRFCGIQLDTEQTIAHDPFDLAALASDGVNLIRTRSVPSARLLERLRDHGLRAIVEIPTEKLLQRLSDGRRGVAAIDRVVREEIAMCAGHPAVLGYALGTVPAALRRWHGRRRIMRCLDRVGRAIRAADPGAIVTYVNRSDGELVDLPSFDLLLVELRGEEKIGPCLARLHNLAGDRPLVVGSVPAEHVGTAFGAGCAGVLLDGWTGSHPALGSALNGGALPLIADPPRVSVVVCTYNGARTLRQCLDGLSRLDYPDYEVIVVDNGSTQDIASVVGDDPVRLIRTAATGLSDARNKGLEAATGALVAYIDDDAWPDVDWLKHLVATFAQTDHVGVGGPNIPPPGDGLVAAAVANSPGNPVHVLLTDEEAEHIPGCNMAFRTTALKEIGGFDVRYRAAGDDVDICWRLQERGGTLGFSPAAFVWHRCRNTVGTYWKQQFGYGRAEAMLEAKWPEKYNSAGHLAWAGRIYSKPITLGLPARLYRGNRGPSVYESAPTQPVGVLRSLPLMPEWYLVILVLTSLSVLGVLWTPLLAVLPVLLLAVGASLGQVWRVAARARFNVPERSWKDTARLRGLTALLNLMQPLARLYGRLRHGLSPWRRHRSGRPVLPLPYRTAIWKSGAQPAETLVVALENTLRDEGFAVRRAADHDHWDLEVRAGALGACRALTAVEDHGSGRQFIRLRTWPRVATTALAGAGLGSVLATLAAVDQAWAAAAILGVAAAAPLLRAGGECGVATRAIREALHGFGATSDTLYEERHRQAVESS